MRRARRTALLLLSVALAACGGGGSGGARANRACPLVDRLHDSADLVAEVDLADPDAFLGALDQAVTEYTATLDRLVEVAPADLRDDLTELRSAVEQYRFDDAVAARAPLDAYAERHCPSPASGQPSASR